MRKLTATQLRSELYRVLDQVLETGEAVEVVRAKGTIVLKPAVAAKVVKRKSRSKCNKDLVVGDSSELVHFDWSKHWKPFL